MTWTVADHGSWHSASSTVPGDLPDAMALPGTWLWHPAGTILVRSDQVANLESDTAPAPTLTSIAPSSVAAGAPDTTVVFTGTGFVPRSVAVNVTGSADLPTTYDSATQLHVDIPASYLAAADLFSVRVRTDPPGGGNSGQQVFTVTA